MWKITFLYYVNQCDHEFEFNWEAWDIILTPHLRVYKRM